MESNDAYNIAIWLSEEVDGGKCELALIKEFGNPGSHILWQPPNLCLYNKCKAKQGYTHLPNPREFVNLTTLSGLLVFTCLGAGPLSLTFIIDVNLS
jgi:hypothetical protein